MRLVKTEPNSLEIARMIETIEAVVKLAGSNEVSISVFSARGGNEAFILVPNFVLTQMIDAWRKEQEQE